MKSNFKFLIHNMEFYKYIIVFIVNFIIIYFQKMKKKKIETLHKRI